MYYPDLSRALEPVTLSLVGLTPMLAVCTTLLSGLTMGFAYLAALLLASVTVSCASRFISERFNFVCLLLIVTTWVSIIDLLLQAGCYALRSELSIYPYLLAMNTTVLVHLETSPLRKNFAESTRAGMKTALIGSGLLAATGLLRELAARGGILTDIHLLAHVETLAFLEPVYLFSGSLHLFASSAGAFIVFGLLLAALSLTAPGRTHSS